MPVLNTGWKPHEYYASLSLLSFGVLFAFALRACLPPVQRLLARAVARPRFRGVERAGAPAVAAVLIAITAAPFFAQVHSVEMFGLNPPAYFRDVLAKDPGEYAILELPIFPSKRGQYGGTYAAFQITHGKERFGASISRDHNLLSPSLFGNHATLFRDFFWQEDAATIERFRPSKQPDFLTPPDYATMGIPLLNYYKVRDIVLYVDALLDQRMIDSANKTVVYDTTERLVHQVLGADAKPVFQDAWPTDLLVFNLSQQRQRAHSVHRHQL